MVDLSLNSFSISTAVTQVLKFPHLTFLFDDVFLFAYFHYSNGHEIVCFPAYFVFVVVVAAACVVAVVVVTADMSGVALDVIVDAGVGTSVVVIAVIVAVVVASDGE